MGTFERLYRHHTVASLRARDDFRPSMLKDHDCFPPLQAEMGVFERLYRHHTAASLAARYDFKPEMMDHHNCFPPLKTQDKKNGRHPSKRKLASGSPRQDRSSKNIAKETITARNQKVQRASPRSVGQSSHGSSLDPPPELMLFYHRSNAIRGKSIQEEVGICEMDDEMPVVDSGLSSHFSNSDNDLCPGDRADKFQGTSSLEEDEFRESADEFMQPYHRPDTFRGKSFDERCELEAAIVTDHREHKARGASFIHNNPRDPSLDENFHTRRSGKGKLFATLSSTSSSDCAIFSSNHQTFQHVQGKRFDESDLDTLLHIEAQAVEKRSVQR